METALKLVDEPKTASAWPLAWRDSLVTFLAGRLFYSLIGYLIWLTKIRPPEADQFYYNITPVLDGPAGALLGVWQRWDGIHYQAIAEQGYYTQHLTAFFPLYPWLAGTISRLTGLGGLPALILVSNLAFLFSLVVLHHLVSGWYSPRIARATLLSLVLFPTAFFFYALYPQSMMLLLALVAIWQAQEQRWWAAALAALLAGLTHGSAILLAPPLAYSAWAGGWREPCLALFRRITAVDRFRAALSRDGSSTLDLSMPRLIPALLPPAAPLLGMAAFEIWGRLAGFQGFSAVHNQGWSRTFHWPWQALVDFSVQIFSTPLEIGAAALWLNIFVFFLAVALTAWSFRRIAWGLWLFQVVSLGFLMVNYVDWNPLLSFFRIYLIVFPVYLEIALLGERKPWRLVFFAASLLLALMCSALFFMWQGSVT